MIETERLILREWRDEDGPEFVRVTNTRAVMEHLGGVDEPGHVLKGVQRQQKLQIEHGHCFWIVERKSDKALLGFCGLKTPVPEGSSIAGETEIGWRLRSDAWGKGYAAEAARASLAWGWDNLDVPRIFAMTVPANSRSWGLMERLGMHRVKELDFDHPDLDADDPLSAHIVYAIDRPY